MKKQILCRFGIILLCFLLLPSYIYSQKLSLSFQAEPFCRGGGTTITLTLLNNDAVDAQNVPVFLSLPSGIFSNIQFGGDGNYNSSTNMWRIESIPANEAVVLTINVNSDVLATGTIMAGIFFNDVITDITAQLDFEIYSKPEVSIEARMPIELDLDGNPVVCYGSSVTLEATGTDSYIWLHNDRAGSALTVFPTENTTFTVQGKNAATGCTNEASKLVIVNPLPPVDIPEQIICIGESATLIINRNSGPFPLVDCFWFHNGSSDFSIIESPTETTTYDVNVLDTNGCVSRGSGTIIVYEYPVLAELIPSPQEICSEKFTTEVPLSASPSDDVWFDWTVVSDGVTGATNWRGGWDPINGEVIGFVEAIPETHLTLASGRMIPGTVTYTVTPKNPGCIGDPGTLEIMVKPLPIIEPIPDAEICSGETMSAIPLQALPAGADFEWTVELDGVAGAEDGSGIEIPETTLVLEEGRTIPGKVTYTVTAMLDDCISKEPIIFEITVNPTPEMEPVEPQSICSGSFTTEETLISSLPNAVFSWTVIEQNGVTGATNGTGSNIPATQLTLDNGKTTPGTVVYEITPIIDDCDGVTELFTVTVNPTPEMTPVAPQTICSGSFTTEETLISSLPADFSWTVIVQDGVTGAEDGSGESIPATQLILDNGRTTPGTVVYEITPTIDSCNGETELFTITVNPAPIMTSVSFQTICSGNFTAVETLISSLPNTVFSWIVIEQNEVTGATNGTGNSIPATQLTLDVGKTTPGTVVYEITPIINGCAGEAQLFKVTVNPTPAITPVAPQPPVCSGNSTSEIILSTIPSSGVDLSWTVVQDGVIGASNGTGNSIPETLLVLVPNRATPGKVTYTIIPSIGSCIGTSETIEIIVNPLPTATILYSETGTVTLIGQNGGTFSAEPTGLMIDVNTGNIDLAASTPNTYAITYSFSDGICANTTVTNITVDNNHQIVTTSIVYLNSPSCGSGNAFVTITGQTGGTFSATPTGLALNPLTGEVDLETSIPNTYIVNYSFVENSTPSTVSTTLVVLPLPSATILLESKNLCENELGKATIEIADGESPYRTIWSLNSIVFSDGFVNQEQTIENLAPGDYQVRIIDNRNCEIRLPLLVSIENKPTVILQTQDIGEICIGSPFELKIINGIGLTDFKWEYSDDNESTWNELSNEPILEDIVKEHRIYRVSAVSNGLCRDSSYAFTLNVRTPVDYLVLSADKTEIAPGDVVAFTVLTNSNLPLIWSAEVINNELKLYKSNDISVKIDDQICESQSDSIRINVIWPTAITPYEKDGYNDNFVPNLDCCTMMIFNRYGQKVHEGISGWDGTYRGKLADPGTYYYVVTLPDGEVKRGPIDVVKMK